MGITFSRSSVAWVEIQLNLYESHTERVCFVWEFISGYFLACIVFFNSFLNFSFSSNDGVHWTCTDQGDRSENIAEAENRKAGGKEEP